MDGGAKDHREVLFIQSGKDQEVGGNPHGSTDSVLAELDPRSLLSPSLCVFVSLSLSLSISRSQCGFLIWERCEAIFLVINRHQQDQ
jgi:hypothetical protein